MCSAQIATTNLGRNNGTPLLVEHDRSAPPVGKVLASWEGRNGELRVTGIVDDQDSQKKIMDGSLQGLSLGTGILLGGGENGTRPLAYQHEELSLCHTPARVGCYIDKVNGNTIRTSAQFSSGSNGSATSALLYALTCTNVPRAHNQHAEHKRHARTRDALRLHKAHKSRLQSRNNKKICPRPRLIPLRRPSAPQTL